LDRRRFLAGAGISVSALALAGAPAILHAAEEAPKPKIRLGLVGCGGRGKWIAKLFQKHGGYQFAAVADYFPERALEAGKLLGVAESACYSGLNGYKKLLETGIDAVVIESPPYFHPEQAAAAVAAGKHVYLAKPIAVDVPGCVSVQESGRAATAKKLCFLVDFQTRANKAYQEAAALVHSGGLGKIVIGEAAYHCGLMFENLDKQLRADPKNPEVRLRTWGIDRKLSGDIITEQNIHALDVVCWMLNAEPIKAEGSGGRRRDFLGDCWDHYAVTYYFPNDVLVSFNSHQSGFGYDDILCRVFGLNGTVDTHYFGNVTVKTKDVYSSVKMENLYSSGAEANIASFHEAILKGDCSNGTVPESVRSNLTTILGRTAAYSRKAVTWREMMKRAERWTVDLKGLKA
jgi:predicted dehydrogenase